MGLCSAVAVAVAVAEHTAQPVALVVVSVAPQADVAAVEAVDAAETVSEHRFLRWHHWVSAGGG